MLMLQQKSKMVLFCIIRKVLVYFLFLHLQRMEGFHHARVGGLEANRTEADVFHVNSLKAEVQNGFFCMKKKEKKVTDP